MVVYLASLYWLVLWSAWGLWCCHLRGLSWGSVLVKSDVCLNSLGLLMLQECQGSLCWCVDGTSRAFGPGHVMTLLTFCVPCKDKGFSGVSVMVN